MLKSIEDDAKAYLYKHISELDIDLYKEALERELSEHKSLSDRLSFLSLLLVQENKDMLKILMDLNNMVGKLRGKKF